MTSRVQKGGPIFRPLVKSRTRPVTDTRQSSVSTDSQSSSKHAGAPNNTQVPLLPSPSVPPSSTSPSDGAPSAMEYPTAGCAPPQPVTGILTSHNILGRPPILSHVNHPPTPSTLGLNPSQNMTPAANIGNQNSPLPIIVGNRSSGRLPSPSTRDIQSSPNSGNNEAIREPQITLSTSPSHVHILHHTGIENVPTAVAPQAGVAINPQRDSVGSTRKQSQNREDNPSQDSRRGINFAKRRKMTHEGPAEPGKQHQRKVRSSVESEASNDESTETTIHKRKRRATSGTPRPRKSRVSSLPPFNVDADPGDEIDPTIVTMASLCSDTGQGRVSRKAAEILFNHAAWKAQSREKRARMKAQMELKKYGRNDEGEDDEATLNTSSVGDDQINPTDPGPSGIPPSSENITVLDDTGSGFDYTQGLITSRFNVQVRIGPNGETIIDEESLVVDRVEAEDPNNYTHVVESDNTKFVNSGSYGKRFRGSRWSAEETESFYDALSQYGENYELIAYVLPGRDRKSCKNKFKAEDKKNPARINYCLSNSIPVDMITLSRMTGKDFSGPVPEIRAPTPQVIEPDVTTETHDIPAPHHTRKKNRQKQGLDDGVLVVGDTGTFEPFPESP